MTFNGDLLAYILFVTMFRNTFDNVIKDNLALFNILSRHLVGSALETILLCIFAKREYRYEKAMGLLKDRYGRKFGVFHAHKLKLLSGLEMHDGIDEFSKISNELVCFKVVTEIYDTASFYSDNIVKNILSKTFSLKKRKKLWTNLF